MNYKDFLKNKRITVIGLGPEGEACADILFLKKLGVEVSVIDTRSTPRIQSYLDLLAEWGISNIVTGFAAVTPPEEYLNPDLYLVACDIPYDLHYLRTARAKGVAIETTQTLFLKCAPQVTLIGILGVCGKSTAAHLTHLMLRQKFLESDQNLIYLDPARPQGCLPILKKIRKGDVVILVMGTALMPSLYAARVSPNVAVITTVSPHDESIFSMLEFQTYNNFVVAGDDVIDQMRRQGVSSKAKMLRTGVSLISGHWALIAREYHVRESIALALRVAELFKVDEDVLRRVAEGFKGMKGRIELAKKVRSVEYWNDAAATNLTATKIALAEIGGNKNVTLILGGMGSPEGFEGLMSILPQYVAHIILLPGTGTSQIQVPLLALDDIKIHYAHTVSDAVILADELTRSHDIVLLSPGFRPLSSWKIHSEEFVKAVRGLLARGASAANIETIAP